jgi:cystathionine beta-synthase
MLDRGWLEVKTVRDLIGGLGRRRLVTIDENANVSDALALMKKYDIEQIPVLLNNDVTGAITQSGLFKRMIENNDLKDFNIGDVKEPALPEVEMDMPLERLKHYISKEIGAVMAKDDSGQYHILTKYDVLNAFSKG